MIAATAHQIMKIGSALSLGLTNARIALAF
jgi:hypothetical protein